MKKYIWAIAACIMVAGVITFVACNKEIPENNISTPQKEKAGSSVINQFETIGEKHNEILWEIGMEFQEDLHNIVLNNGISEEEALKLQARIEDWGRHRFHLLLEGQCDSLLADWHIDIEKSADVMMKDSMLNLILDHATSMGDLFVTIESHEKEIYSNMKSLDDTIQLLSLVVMRHSLAFWIDAYYNPENPWHEIAYYMPYPIDTKGIPEVWGSVKKWVKEKVVPFIGEIVTAAVELVGMDYITWKACAAEWIGFGSLLGVPEVGFGLSVGCAAVGSAIGGINGWTHPWF